MEYWSKTLIFKNMFYRFTYLHYLVSIGCWWPKGWTKGEGLKQIPGQLPGAAPCEQGVTDKESSLDKHMQALRADVYSAIDVYTLLASRSAVLNRRVPGNICIDLLCFFKSYV